MKTTRRALHEGSSTHNHRYTDGINHHEKLHQKKIWAYKEEWKSKQLNEKQHLNVPNDLFLSLSPCFTLSLSQGVIILNGAPCDAISAVKHQRKWIIENMIFWSGGVKESYPLPAVVSPAVHWSMGSLNLSHSWVTDAAPLCYSALRYGTLPPRHPFRSL